MTDTTKFDNAGEANKDKFTGKAEVYTRFRPSYPAAFIDYLEKELGISGEKTVADVGAGTGILTRLISGKAGTVLAVEPNADMRRACADTCLALENVSIID
ncbi:MAG: hypothetical protein HGA22_09965, partial [Clostridiales bacterium]|nr:hypothetical protein [Clostridiales bacterium]